MGQEKLKIEKMEKVTHNVIRFTLDDSEKIKFSPGQATDLSVDKDEWRDEAHPFTFTSLPNQDYLEFTIKIYPDHEGVTDQLSKLDVGDTVILHEVWGAIEYKGRGTFIAGGAGVTPFISIIRDLHQKDELEGNRLIFANSKEEDIINKEEFEKMLGDDFLNILSREEVEPYGYGRIDTEYLRKNITSVNDYFYICGPEKMMEAVEESLKELGVKEDKIVKEVFN